MTESFAGSDTSDPMAAVVDDGELASLRREVERLRESNRQHAEKSAHYQTLLHRMERVHRSAKLLFWECDGEALTWCGSLDDLAEFLGVSLEQCPTNDVDLLNLIHSDDRQRVKIAYNCGSENEVDFNIEYRMTMPDGSTKYIHEIGLTRRDKNCFIGHSGAMRDITERTLAERERERLIEELEARNSELEQFTYTVSHDLKAPLITVRGFLGLLEKDLEQHDLTRIREDMDKIRDATEGMKNVLEDLLRLSRIGRFVNPETETSLKDVVEDVLRMIGGMLTERGVDVVVQPELPAVYGDRVRIVELVQNLLENAAKFMGDQDSPKVEVGALHRGDEVMCYVADNGVGIDERYHDRIFGLFQTLGTEQSGTGVGLALAKKIVDFHGGRLWVESRGHGLGSRFCFTLPTRSVAAA